MNYSVELKPSSRLNAYSLEEARLISSWFSDSIIVDSNGSWRDQPLCAVRRKRLAEIHGFAVSFTLNPKQQTKTKSWTTL